MEDIEKFTEEQRVVPTKILLLRAEEHVIRLCATGGSSWSLRVPPDVGDPDMVFTEVCRRLENAEEQNARLLAAVREMERVSGVLYWIESERPQWWAEATDGSGIATLNAYRQALQTALANRSKP